MRPIFAALVVGTLCLFTGSAAGQNKTSTAADFPVGIFSDGNTYQLDDFKGKVVVLYFFEQTCPSCRKLVPERNKVVQSFAGKPVRFVGIAPNASAIEAAQYKQSTGLAMPIFADTYALMERRYNIDISLQNIYQTRIIDTNGKVTQANLEEDAIEKVLARSKTEVKIAAPEGFDPKFAPLVEMLDLGQWASLSKTLTAVKRTAKKGDLPALNTVHDMLKKEATAAVEEAKTLTEFEPIKAYDIYAKVAASLPTEDLGKVATKSMKTLAADKKVKAELSARTAFAKVTQAMAQVEAPPSAGVISACNDIAKKHPGTPTGDKAKAFADELKASAK